MCVRSVHSISDNWDPTMPALVTTPCIQRVIQCWLIKLFHSFCNNVMPVSVICSAISDPLLSFGIN